jgi:hypothetical protein
VRYVRLLLVCALGVVTVAVAGTSSAAAAPRLVVTEGHEVVPTGTEVTAPLSLGVYEAGEGTALFQCPLELSEGMLDTNHKVVDAAMFGGIEKAAGSCIFDNSRQIEFKFTSAPAKLTVSVAGTVAVTFKKYFELEFIAPDHGLPCIYRLKKLEGDTEPLAEDNGLTFGASGVLTRVPRLSRATCASVLTAVISAAALFDTAGQLKGEVTAR